MALLLSGALFPHWQNGKLSTNIPITAEQGVEVGKTCGLRKVLILGF